MQMSIMTQPHLQDMNVHSALSFVFPYSQIDYLIKTMPHVISIRKNNKSIYFWHCSRMCKKVWKCWQVCQVSTSTFKPTKWGCKWTKGENCRNRS